MFWSRGDSCSDIIAQEKCMNTRYRASILPASTSHDHHIPLWADILKSIALWKANLASSLCRWYASYRSFRGHIRIQSAKETARVHLGPSVQFRDRCYQANLRTLARAEGIEKLQAIHPWVDIGDLHIFLMGFDVGEEYSNTHCHLQDTPI